MLVAKQRLNAKLKVDFLKPSLDQLNAQAAHLINSGDGDAAIELIEQVLAAVPRDPTALTLKAIVLRLSGQLREAILHCDAAIEAAPDYAEAWLQRGFVLASGGSMDGARACYARVVALDPYNADALAGLAAIGARGGDGDEARAHAAQALAIDPGNIIALCAVATMDIESKKFAAACDALVPLAATMDTVSADRSMLFGLLGDAHHGLGEVDAAFSAYARAKGDFAALHAPRIAGREPHHAMIDRIGAQIPKLGSLHATSPLQPANAAATHVFLMGYPRSGTTLVENILASLPDVFALEERPTLGDADQAFLLGDDGLITFAALDEAELDTYRTAYWNKVAASGLDVAGKVFVDMDPLKATRLPLIARLFPHAKILLMRRDPRDCVWSCFHTNFALTSAALEFTTIESAARHYDRMMAMTQAALTHLSLDTHVVRYDALVKEFDATTQAMCDFLGIAWSDALRSFDKTAQSRGVSTASAGQVRKGLYDGSRQWEQYRAYLDPVLPILQPWVEQFGFDT